MARRRGRIARSAARVCVLAAMVVFVVAGLEHSASSSSWRTGGLRVMQFNLCNSGIADCYTGRAVPVASELLRELRPDVVTLNEICQGDLPELAHALGRSTVTAFRPALNRRDDQPVRCRNGEKYGIGLVVRGSGPTGTYGGVYPMQDAHDVEKRVWLCVRAAGYLCTTHLDSERPVDAYAQCRYLMSEAIPAMLAQHGDAAVVVAGDLNLRTGHAPDPRSCVPASYAHVDDGARQHLMASGRYRVASADTVDMQGTTDHPGLLVDLTIR